jgi:hypothetical protein
MTYDIFFNGLELGLLRNWGLWRSVRKHWDNKDLRIDFDEFPGPEDFWEGLNIDEWLMVGDQSSAQELAVQAKEAYYLVSQTKYDVTPSLDKLRRLQLTETESEGNLLLLRPEGFVNALFGGEA